MPIEREAVCGSEERSDALVRVRPADELQVTVHSKSGPMYEDRIAQVTRECVNRLGFSGAHIEVREFGAYDHVIAARVEGALWRAEGGGEEFHRPLTLQVSRTATSRDRFRRSRLYAPGNSARTLAFADAFGPDCLLLDLEDAVPTGEKDGARFLVRRVLSALDFGETELWVRINPLERSGHDDLRIVLGGRPHGICLPKAESAVQVTELAGRLYEMEGRYGLPWRVWIMPIIESPKGVFAAPDIARASERVVCLAFGAEDYTREVGCSRDRDALLWPRAQVVSAAKAAGIQASDSVFADVEDEHGLVEDTAHAAALGFDGKGVIHPLQIDAVHQALAPSAEQVRWAHGVVSAAEEAERKGTGAVTYQGSMVDRPVLLRARRILEVARKLGMEVENAS